ncbi:MAG: hypothetical protein KAI83_16630, partial [Thiomargarita sp.]|nr:hypothetical protein [Thiomargarita sp.]
VGFHFVPTHHTLLIIYDDEKWWVSTSFLPTLHFIYLSILIRYKKSTFSSDAIASKHVDSQRA